MRRPDVVERDEIRARQEKVWHLIVVRRLSELEAAEILTTSERTIRRDLAAMRTRGGKELQSLASQEHVLSFAAEMWGQLSSVLREAWVSVQAAESASPVRVRALNLVRTTVREMAEILQSLGLLPKAPEEVVVGTRDVTQLNDSQLEAAVAFFLSLTPDRAELTGAALATTGSAAL